MRGRVLRTVVVLGAVLLLAGCAAAGNDLTNTPATNGDVAGFWLGLWHGLICPITFVVSLFTETVGVYAVHNNGGWYDLGFLFGASIVFGGGAGGGACGRKRRVA